MTASSPTSPRTATLPPLERTAARVGAVAVLVMAWSGVAFALGWPWPQAALPLAASVGIGGALLVQLQQKPRLCALWAEVTMWIAIAFWCAHAFNFVRRASLLGALDLALSAWLVLGAMWLVRRARRLRRSR